MSLRGVAARFQGKLSDAPAQDKHNLMAWQARAFVDRYMRHATVCNCTRVQLLLDTERRMRKSVKPGITALRTLVSDHSSLVGSAMASLYSGMGHAYETCMRSFLSDFAWCTHDCGAVSYPDVDAHFVAYESPIEQGVHFILASVDHNVEHIHFDDASADLQ